MPRGKTITTNPQYKMAKLYHELFSGATGQKVLTDLRNMFYDLSLHVPGDTFASTVRIGQHEVILHIRQMLSLAGHPELFTSAEETEEI